MIQFYAGAFIGPEDSNNHVLIQTYTRVVAVATHKGIGKMAKLVLLW